MMRFPLAQEYQQALQRPDLSLFDNELKGGKVELDKLGLPRARSGNFASVYKIFAGGAVYAVKCFLNAPGDLQMRCEQISDYLKGINCVYFLDTQYIARGVSVNGQTFPILKMPWQEGIPIDRYIGQCVKRQDKQGILNAAGHFLNMYKTLRSYGVAHGDLQHGNILITPDGGLVLIDYDGLYCPSAWLKSGHESGHPNYQHPKRNSSHYDLQIDSFPAIVILTALTVLAADLGFWQRYYNGDNLLFCGRDFLNPNQSPLFRTLAACSDDSIRRLAAEIAAACMCSYEKMPDFTALLEELNTAGGNLPPLILANSWQPKESVEPHDKTVVEPVNPVNSIAASAGMTTMQAVCQDKVICRNCSALNGQSAALCFFCGYVLSIPLVPIQQQEAVRLPDRPTVQPDTGVSFFAKLKLTILYFILFSLAIAAYDQTDNNRDIPLRILALLNEGKDKLLARIKDRSGEIAVCSKLIAASPNNAAAYFKRGDAYMKAGRFSEAAADYKAAARIAIEMPAQRQVNTKNNAIDNNSGSK
ncbi:MAG: hypothetical protein L7F77_10445 [Candidatus Magnetominusculus sp. LBB02]|nr:hypothetical protein [Candidatus Magnetominusculus sp. LBB02]